MIIAVSSPIIESESFNTMNNKYHRILLSAIGVLLYFILTNSVVAATARTVTVSAEGLADPSSPAYQRDKGKLIDALRDDAKRQVIEKAVGMLVSGSTLVENYELIQDRVLTQSAGLIKNVDKWSSPWMGEDGFMHILIRAEVYVAEIQESLKAMSKSSRIDLLKQYDNPTISIAIYVKDANRRSLLQAERSPIAENILMEHLKSFGYRVKSEEVSQKLKMELIERSSLDNQSDVTLSATHQKASDFSITGEAKFKSNSVTLKASGVTITKYVLTSWTVKCTNNHNGENIYVNNKIPRKKSWPDEDVALADIGKLIGNEFSQDFFEEHLMAPSKIFNLELLGLPDYDVAKILKKELIGLRPVLNVDLRDFNSDGLSLYEIEFAGSRGDFQGLINDTLVYPLNQKLGNRYFKLDSAQGGIVRVSFSSDEDIGRLMAKFNGMPPASLSNATAERLKDLVHNEDTMKKIAAINPKAVEKLAKSGDSNASNALQAIDDF